jgi:hypothetical protein
VSYWTMMSLAVQSSRWEQSMNTKLIQMAVSSGQALVLQEAGTQAELQGIEQHEAAVMDEAKAVELQKEATVLLEQSKADAALAATDQVEVEELSVKLAELEEQSAAHAAAAAVEEETFESEVAEATVNAEQATRLEVQAEGDEVGIAVCEFFPLLDIVCDLVGGIVAVGLQVDAAAVATTSTAEFATAAAAKVDEQTELDLAAGLQGDATETSGAAAELQVQQDELEQAAEAERVKAEEEEVASKGLDEKATIEEESAIANEVQAGDEQLQATALFQQSVEHGVHACWDAIMANALGLIAFGYFCSRVVSTVVVMMLPNVIHLAGVVQLAFYPTPSSSSACNPTKQNDRQLHHHGSWGRDLSYMIHHGSIFLLTLSSWNIILSRLGGSDLRTRGACILLFAGTGGAVQVVVLHALPRGLIYVLRGSVVTTTTAACGGARLLWFIAELAVRTVSMTLLFGLEILLLWVNFGPQSVSPLWLHQYDLNTRTWMGWAVLTVTLGLHFWYLEVPHYDHQQHLLAATGGKSSSSLHVPTSSPTIQSCEECQPLLGTLSSETCGGDKSSKTVASVKDDNYDDEADYLPILIDQIPSSNGHTYETGTSTLASTRTTTKTVPMEPSSTATIQVYSICQELGNLKLPLEVLILSCMLAILRHCVGSVRALWPTSKALLRHTAPEQWMGVSVAGGIILLVFSVVYTLERRRSSFVTR